MFSAADWSDHPDMGNRRQARELALQILFQWDIHGNTDHWLADFWEKQDVDPEVRAFTDCLVDGVMARRADLDREIGDQASNWKVSRMPIVDRNILRAAVFELLEVSEVPAKVTVNEAIELAKRFADEEGKAFVNGILDAILKRHPKLEAKRAQMELSTG
ncbi:MAG: transcription antitermination factor NusB [Nitrospirales bacterium]